MVAAILISSMALAQKVTEPELPGGWGDGVQGVFIFAHKCSACHSERDSRGAGDAMELCWHDAKGMFNFVRQAMPFNAPGSLKDKGVYAVVAYPLSQARIIKRSDVLNARTLPAVKMPLRAIPDHCSGTVRALLARGALYQAMGRPLP
jgi:hypothetical protein